VTLCRPPAAGVFDPRHGWVVIFRHEEGYEVPTWPLTMFMGSDRNAIDLGTAAERQTRVDKATLGQAGAATRGKPWLKAEDLRSASVCSIGCTLPATAGRVCPPGCDRLASVASPARCTAQRRLVTAVRAAVWQCGLGFRV